MATADSSRPTMRDVAVRAGVSRQLVSLVLRGAAGPSTESRDRVLKAANDLGYEPDVAAQSLRRRRSGHLGVIFTLSHPFEQELIASLYPRAEQRGLSLLLHAFSPHRDAQATVSDVLGYRTEAVVLIGGDLRPSDIRRMVRRCPVIGVGRESFGTDIDTVSSAGDAGVDEAVDHLASLGHRRIAYLDAGKEPGAELRRAGYLRGMARHSLEAEILLVPAGYSEEDGAGAARSLLDSGELPTAVIAANDQSALGLMATLQLAGVPTPESISVIGFDDSPLARLSYVGLTTVRQDIDRMSDLVLRAVTERLAGRTEARRLVIPPSLVIRNTTTTPRTVAR